MSAREATCSCGQLRLEAEGEPVRISICPDPTFPAPRVSVYESSRHPWVAVPEGAEHVG